MSKITAKVTNELEQVSQVVNKSFSLIQQLDDLLTNSKKKLDKRTKLYVADLKQDLALQAYEMLDQESRRLDRIIIRGVRQDERKQKHNTSGMDEKKKRFKQEIEGVNMEVDPDEPTYCICGQVSFGEMIACDNPTCEKEWFHIQCVGAPQAKNGKWCKFFLL